MLTYGYWQRRFGGDRSILGRTLTIESRPRAVIGVMPEDFRFRGDPELIVPLRLERNTLSLGPFSYPGHRAAQTRRQPGAGQRRCRSHAGGLVECLASESRNGSHRISGRSLRPRLQSLKQDIVGDIGTALWVIMGTLGLVLLIACANVANLLLVRAEARQQELAIRAALGAGWRRIARALLVESMTLGLLGGAVGLGLAYGALRILVAKGPETLPRLRDIGHRSGRAGVHPRCVSARGRALRGHPRCEIRRTPSRDRAAWCRPHVQRWPGTPPGAQHAGRHAGGARARAARSALA